MTLNTGAKVILSIVFSILFFLASLLFGLGFLYQIFDNDMYGIIVPGVVSLILAGFLISRSLKHKSYLVRYGLALLFAVLLIPMFIYIFFVLFQVALGDTFLEALW